MVSTCGVNSLGPSSKVSATSGKRGLPRVITVAICAEGGSAVVLGTGPDRENASADLSGFAKAQGAPFSAPFIGAGYVSDHEPCKLRPALAGAAIASLKEP